MSTLPPKYWVSYTSDERVPEKLRGTVIYRGNNKREALRLQKQARKSLGWWATDSFQTRGPF